MKKALVVMALVIFTGVGAFAGNFYVQDNTTLMPLSTVYRVSNTFTFGYVAPELYWSIGVANTYGTATYDFPLKGGFTATIYDTQTSSLAANLAASFTPELAFTSSTSFTYTYDYGMSAGITYTNSGFNAGVTYTYPASTIVLHFRYDFPETVWSKGSGTQ